MIIEDYPEDYWPIFTSYEATSDGQIRPTPGATVEKLTNPSKWDFLSINNLKSLCLVSSTTIEQGDAPEIVPYSPAISSQSYNSVVSAFETLVPLDIDNILPESLTDTFLNPAIDPAILQPVLDWVAVLGLPFVEIQDSSDIIAIHKRGIQLNPLLTHLSNLRLVVEIKSSLHAITRKQDSSEEYQQAMELLQSYGRFINDGVDVLDPIASCATWMNQRITKALKKVTISPNSKKFGLTLGPLDPMTVFYLRIAETEHPPSHCLHCGTWFQPKTNQDKYCTREHQDVAKKLRNRPIAEARRLHAKGVSLEEIASRTDLTLEAVSEALPIKRIVNKSH